MNPRPHSQTDPMLQKSTDDVSGFWEQMMVITQHQSDSGDHHRQRLTATRLKNHNSNVNHNINRAKKVFPSKKSGLFA